MHHTIKCPDLASLVPRPFVGETLELGFFFNERTRYKATMSLKKFVLLFMMKPVACSSLNNEGGGWSPKVIMGHQGFICGCFATNQGYG